MTLTRAPLLASVRHRVVADKRARVVHLPARGGSPNIKVILVLTECSVEAVSFAARSTTEGAAIMRLRSSLVSLGLSVRRDLELED